MSDNENVWLIVGVVVVALLLWFLFCRGSDPINPQPTPTPTNEEWRGYFTSNLTLHRGMNVVTVNFTNNPNPNSGNYNVTELHLLIHDGEGDSKHILYTAAVQIQKLPIVWSDCFNLYSTQIAYPSFINWQETDVLHLSLGVLDTVENGEGVLLCDGYYYNQYGARIYFGDFPIYYNIVG